jgi:hypothetical protein
MFTVCPIRKSSRVSRDQIVEIEFTSCDARIIARMSCEQFASELVFGYAGPLDSRNSPAHLNAGLHFSSNDTFVRQTVLTSFVFDFPAVKLELCLLCKMVSWTGI